MHYFDTFGWYTSTPIPGRAVDIEPPSTSETAAPGEPRANWLGTAWDVLPYVAPPPAADPLDGIKAALTEAATAQRWTVETGGITLNGMRVGTTKADQDRITSVVANADLAGVTEVDFKAASGWATLSIAEVHGVAAAIALHVQACFSAERAHHEAIEALDTVEEAEAYDVTVGWPA